jgi:hypothetical protein
MAPTLIYYHLHDSSSNMDSPWIILGLLLGGLCVYVPMALASALAKWSLLSFFKHRPKILGLCGVMIVELFILLGLALLIWQWPGPEMKSFLPMTLFGFCAMFPNLLLLPAPNSGVDNWFIIRRFLYAFGLGCVSAICVVLVWYVLDLAFRGLLIPI